MIQQDRSALVFSVLRTENVQMKMFVSCGDSLDSSTGGAVLTAASTTLTATGPSL